MSGGAPSSARQAETRPQHGRGVLCPFDLTVSTVERMLNCELIDHPVYDGLELQYFDDPTRGRGMLAFLSRRDGRRVDYYHQPGLDLDRESFNIAGGTGAWNEVGFDRARLEVFPDGVVAEARFTDVDGRLIEVEVDDRDGRPRKRGRLLAPVSSSTERPSALLLVWLHGFDLVRASGAPPAVWIDGENTAIGTLPGARVHRHLLVKYASPLCAVELNRNRAGPMERLPLDDPGQAELTADGTAISSITAAGQSHSARLTLDPALPDLRSLDSGEERRGRWAIEVDGEHITGGTWSVARRGEGLRLGMEVEERWRPGPLPLLMRVVTRVVPVFREWPTTYRWTAEVAPGPAAVLTSRWERAGDEPGASYGRLIGSEG